MPRRRTCSGSRPDPVRPFDRPSPTPAAGTTPGPTDVVDCAVQFWRAFDDVRVIVEDPIAIEDGKFSVRWAT